MQRRAHRSVHEHLPSNAGRPCGAEITCISVIEFARSTVLSKSANPNGVVTHAMQLIAVPEGFYADLPRAVMILECNSHTP